MSPTAEALAVENERLRARVKDLEQALTDAERTRFFATIIENLNDGVSVVDEEGAVIYESPNVAAITGRPKGEVRGESFLDYIHPDEREEIAALFADHVEAPGEWRSAMIRFLHANGSYRTLESRAVNLLDVEPIHGFLAIYRDVTEQQATMSSLEDAHRRLGEITSSVPGLVFQVRTTHDAHSFTIPYVSNSPDWFVGDGRKAVRDDAWLLFDRIHAEDKPRFFESVRQAAANADGFSVDFRLQNGDEDRWLRCNAACHLGGDETLLFTCVAFDVTAEKQSEELLRQAWLDVELRVQERTAELRASNERLLSEIAQREQAEHDLQTVEHKVDVYERIMTTGELMTGVAHDLHQPLTAISNYAGGCLLRLDRGILTDDDLRRIFGEIRDSALHAADIVRHMLDFTRTRRFQREPLPANDLCALAVRLARVALLERSARLEEEFAEDLPDVLADRLPVAQVVLNLLVNASQALESRPEDDRVIRLRTSLDEQPGFVRISVADNGPGLPKHQHETIFDRFVTSKQSGLGLGLSICRTIVELHDGRIWVESEPGEGCTFHCTLPVASVG